MTTSIRFLGIAAFEITTSKGEVILLDPHLDENPVSPVKVADLQQVDLVLVSHLAYDHLGDTAAIAKKFGSHVVCDQAVKHFLEREGVDPNLIRTVPWGGQVNPRGIRVRGVLSMHSSIRTTPDGQLLTGSALGFILYADPDVRIYHSGDTAIFGDLKLIGELYRPNIGLLCCCELERKYLEDLGLFDHCGNEMSGDEGALAALWLGLDYALCCHYLSPEAHPDVEMFVNMLESRRLNGEAAPMPVVLTPGDTFTYPTEIGG